MRILFNQDHLTESRLPWDEMLTWECLAMLRLPWVETLSRSGLFDWIRIVLLNWDYLEMKCWLGLVWLSWDCPEMWCWLWIAWLSCDCLELRCWLGTVYSFTLKIFLRRDVDLILGLFGWLEITLRWDFESGLFDWDEITLRWDVDSGLFGRVEVNFL